MSKVDPIVLTADTSKERMKEITDRLEQGITELFDSERYKEYLQVMSRFHNYSFNNTVLIAMQKPDASYIAGYNAWKNNFGRNVKKGEKGIRILAPSPYKIRQEVEKKDPETGKAVLGKDGKPVMETKEIPIPAYKVVYVFDISQTEGRELPRISANELTGDVEKYEDFFAALEMTSPVPMEFERIEGTAHGYYSQTDKRIAINEGMSQLQNLKTAIHEIAHAKLHDIDLNAPKEEQKTRPDRRTREVQAESIAYTVCQHYGLDTSDYSFGYVAGWSSGRELAELKASLETIRATAAEIINSVDGHLAELTREKNREEHEEQQTGKMQKKGTETELKEVKVKLGMKNFLENLSENNREGMLNTLLGVPLDIKDAVFTINGNAIKSQEAILESGENKVSVRFYNQWEPMQVRKPTSAIKQSIDIISYKNGNATAIRTLSEKKSMSLKNAEKNYYEMLKQWIKLTKQPEITFASKAEQHSNKSVLADLHKKQEEISGREKGTGAKQHIRDKEVVRG